MPSEFFNTQTRHSLAKANIVSKSFFAWARVMKFNTQRYRHSSGKIAYIDLYAGRGRYQDGSSSTPIMILEQAITDPEMCRMLVTHFNDKDEKNCTALTEEISKIPGIQALTYSPKVYNGEVDESMTQAFASINLIPTFFFLDPWGYKGLSLSLVKGLLRHWGTDGVFFFSYMSIRRGLNIHSVETHMAALFGQERVHRLRESFKNSTPKECERLICKALDEALKELGAKYTLFFRFRHPKRNRTSHYLVFVTKDFLGYSIMKDIMAKEGLHIEDIPLFYFDPEAENLQEQYQTKLLTEKSPLVLLEEQIYSLCRGKTLNRPQVYAEHVRAHHSDLYFVHDNHIIGPPFLPRHYTQALLSLKDKGKISFDREPKKKGTLAETILITFE